MKTVTRLATIAMMIASGVSMSSASEVSPEQLFTANCASCHTTNRVADRSEMLAPPISGAIRHVKEKFANRADAVVFMVDYIQNPSKDKAQCESKSIERFGLMPSMKGVLKESELVKLAEYLYDNYPNGKGHGQGKGQGKGYGKGHGQGHGKGQGRGHGQGKGQGKGQGRLNQGM